MKKGLWASLRMLRVRIIAIVALCWLLPTLVLGVYMSSIFFDALQEKTQQALVSGASHAQEIAVREIERVLKKSKDITYDEQIAEYATKYQSGAIRYEEFFSLSRTYWHRMFQRERLMDFAAFFLLEDPERLVYTAADVSFLRHFQEQALEQVLSLGERLDTRSSFLWVEGHLYHVRNLLNRKLERFGMMVLEVDPAELLAPLRGEDTLWLGRVDILLDEYAYIADANYPFDRAQYREGLYEEADDLYYGKRVATADYDLTYRIRLDADTVFGQRNEYFETIVVLILLLLPIEALILLFIHQTVTRPLTRLMEVTQRMADGELGVTVLNSRDDEIGRLGTAFNAMSIRMEQLIEKSYKEELALRDAHISELQSRINPHFVNNALELMNWQARIEGADTVSQMIEALSTLINAALDRGNERTVTLKEDVEVADAYFYFVGQRFGDRLRIEKDIEPAAMDARVPRLAVQTLLENAVEHGISPAGGGVIRLSVYHIGEWLYIDVFNNGHKINDEDRETIRRLLSDDGRDTRFEHSGIRNVNLRLKLIYHGRASLALGSLPDGETRARIMIPCGENAGMEAKEADAKNEADE